MSNYAALQAVWPSVTGADTAAKLAMLNAMTVAGPAVDIQFTDLIGYLALSLKLPTFDAYASGTPTATNSTAFAAAQTMTLMPKWGLSRLETSDPATYQKVQQLLEALAADAGSGITSSDVTAIMALAATTVPWWQANGFSQAIGTADLALAGGLS